MRTIRMLLMVVGLVATVSPGRAAAQGPIKIGFLSPISGAAGWRRRAKQPVAGSNTAFVAASAKDGRN